MTATIVPLRGVVQSYAWGSPTAIPELLGEPATGQPQAELWLGAHPLGPSRLASEATLAEAIAADPAATLGPTVAATYHGRLPFLLKVLAAAQPLSLQAHPSPEQAAAGFAREEAADIPLDAPHRNYPDANAKPELICPLGPFQALCGFRDPAVTVDLLADLGVPVLGPLVDALAAGDVRAAVEWVLGQAESEGAAPLVGAVAAAVRADGSGPFTPERRWAADLAGRHPGDVGVVLALLLNLVELDADDAVELPAGNLHAYLGGVGIEIMANSDNVLRGGLTSKHVDGPELLAVLDCTPVAMRPLRPRTVAPGVEVWDSSAPEFRLSRLRPAGGTIPLAPEGPEILLAVDGDLAAGDLPLARGQAAFVPAAAGPYGVTGTGTAYRATVGRP